MNIDVELLKKLRNETEASVSDCRSAIIESESDYKKALEIIRKRGVDKASKKSERAVKSGVVMVSSHQEGKIGVYRENWGKYNSREIREV
jgi:elongation factor Ts